MKLGDKNGMVMALSLFCRLNNLVLVAAYENGLVVVAELVSENTWEVTYGATVHSQPILSLDVAPDKAYFFTSSADALIVKHPIPQVQASALQRQQHGQAPTTSESPTLAEKNTEGASLLSAALASQHQPGQPQPKSSAQIQRAPLKTVNTKHSGQQSLKIRSDSRIFATAGWDSKIRVYSVKTMKEVAVLTWHQVGCYSVAFSTLDKESGGQGETASEAPVTQGADSSSSTAGTVVPKLVDMTLRDKRLRHAKTAHWLAAGSKDGRVSLWDVF